MQSVIIRDLGRCDYQKCWDEMKNYTDQRDASSPDQIWLLEHPPVFTEGQASKPEHLLNPGDIPVIKTDRGGQVTYHGPGQLVAYLLYDIKRADFAVRDFVRRIEQAVVDVLANFEIEGTQRCDAPGVYVGAAKIASLGLRIRKFCSYHGLSFNINMDLSPFLRINPCGFRNLAMTQLADFVPDIQLETVKPLIVEALLQRLRVETYGG